MESFQDTVDKHYHEAVHTYTDINQHVPTLSRYAEECNSVVEFGVRSGVSTWGVINGLLKHTSSDNNTTLHGYDLQGAPWPYQFLDNSPGTGLNSTFTQANVLQIPPVECDMLFIDTFHVYGQLRRELSRHAQGVRKYIIMYDTTVDEWEGEVRRCCWDAATMEAQTGIPAGELLIGLWPAVTLFLEGHPEWGLKERFTNNNGLTVLERRAAAPVVLEADVHLS